LEDLKTVDGAGSGLDADLLDGRQMAVLSTASTIVSRDANGDINARLFRSEFDGANPNIGYIMTQVDTADNNYIRPSTPAQFRAAVTDGVYLPVAGNAASATKLATARTISLTGDVTGSVSFDGSANASITTVVADDSHNHIVANVDGLQTALDSKQATITGGATTITSANLTASRALTSDASGKVAVSAVTSTELGYLSGVTSNVQAQLNSVTSASTPTGAVLPFATKTVPSGWLKCNGAAISRTTYASLFARIGTTFGTGDGTTTFKLPDLRGEFIRGFDDARGIDAGRVFGSLQNHALQTITGRFAFQSAGEVSGAFYHSSGSSYGWYATKSELISFDSSRVTNGAAETRPRNIALMYCIKY
jgi:microcystin-dependent protein